MKVGGGDMREWAAAKWRNLPCPGLLFALKGPLSFQLFHESNGDLLLSRVRFGGGDGSRHAKIPKPEFQCRTKVTDRSKILTVYRLVKPCRGREVWGRGFWLAELARL